MFVLPVHAKNIDIMSRISNIFTKSLLSIFWVNLVSISFIAGECTH